MQLLVSGLVMWITIIRTYSCFFLSFYVCWWYTIYYTENNISAKTLTIYSSSLVVVFAQLMRAWWGQERVCFLYTPTETHDIMIWYVIFYLFTRGGENQLFITMCECGARGEFPVEFFCTLFTCCCYSREQHKLWVNILQHQAGTILCLSSAFDMRIRGVNNSCCTLGRYAWLHGTTQDGRRKGFPSLTTTHTVLFLE